VRVGSTSVQVIHIPFRLAHATRVSCPQEQREPNRVAGPVGGRFPAGRAAKLGSHGGSADGSVIPLGSRRELGDPAWLTGGAR